MQKPPNQSCSTMPCDASSCSRARLFSLLCKRSRSQHIHGLARTRRRKKNGEWSPDGVNKLPEKPSMPVQRPEPHTLQALQWQGYYLPAGMPEPAHSIASRPRDRIVTASLHTLKPNPSILPNHGTSLLTPWPQRLKQQGEWCGQFPHGMTPPARWQGSAPAGLPAQRPHPRGV